MKRPKSILVADADAGLREMLMALLQREGFVVHGTDSAEEAVALARERHPDLVLMDVLLPGIGGVEAARRIKANPQLEDVFVVHLSGQTADTVRLSEGLLVGALGYIARPVEDAELVSRVRAFLRHKEALDSLRASEQRYRALYESNPLPIWIYEAESWVILDANVSAARHFGVARGELTGRALAELVVPEQRDSFQAALRAEDSAARQRTWSYVTQTGAVIEVEAVEQSLNWNGVAARAALLNDVTWRNRLERERQALLERYEREFHSLQSVSEFQQDKVSEEAEQPTHPGFALHFDRYLQSYVLLVRRALEQKIYRVAHNVSSELQGLAGDLFGLAVSPRDLVDLHCAAMRALVPEPTAKQAQGLLESGRLVIVELMGYVLAAYRNCCLRASTGPMRRANEL